VKAVTVREHTYSSIAEAWRQVSPINLRLVTVRWRLRTGWSPEDAFTRNMVPPENRRTFKDLERS